MVPLWYHYTTLHQRISAMKLADSSRRKLIRLNRKDARRRWGSPLNQAHMSNLRELTMQFGFSLAMGDLMLLESRWYVTHSGLIRIAQHNGCVGINVRPALELSDASTRRWAFQATVDSTLTSSGGNCRRVQSQEMERSTCSNMPTDRDWSAARKRTGRLQTR